MAIDVEGLDGSGFGGPGGGRAGGRNVLAGRFLANTEYAQLVENRTDELTTAILESGDAADVLGDWVAVLHTGASDLVADDTIEAEAAGIAEYF